MIEDAYNAAIDAQETARGVSDWAIERCFRNDGASTGNIYIDSIFFGSGDTGDTGIG